MHRFALSALRRPSAIAAALVCAALVVVASAPFAHEPDAEEVALGSLVDAELAFARMASQRGVRAAFVANFADDGVALEPEPVRVRDAWPKRPAPADPLALHLEWKPAQAGVAKSHDFGYTTGPFVLWSAQKPDARGEGAFFSVWRRDPAGTWQVILDAGVATPSSVNFASLGASPRPAYTGRANPVSARAALMAHEADAFGAGADGLTPNDYAKLLADDARLHRNDAPVIASRAEIARTLAGRIRRVTWTPIDARIASSADMAVTYGRYRETDRAAAVAEGYYAHLWIRDGAGRWRLAYDVALPAS